MAKNQLVRAVAVVAIAALLTVGVVPPAHAVGAGELIDIGSIGLIALFTGSLLSLMSYSLFMNSVDTGFRADTLPYWAGDATTRHLSRASLTEDGFSRSLYAGFTNLGESHSFQFGGLGRVGQGNLSGFGTYQMWDQSSQSRNGIYESLSATEASALAFQVNYGWRTEKGGIGLGFAFADASDDRPGYLVDAGSGQERFDSDYMKLNAAYSTDPDQEFHWAAGIGLADGSLDYQFMTSSPIDPTNVRFDMGRTSYHAFGRGTWVRGDRDYELSGTFGTTDGEIDNPVIWHTDYGGSSAFEERITSSNLSQDFGGVRFTYLHRVNEKLDFAAALGCSFEDWDSSYRGNAFFDGEQAGDIDTKATWETGTISIPVSVRYWSGENFALTLGSIFTYTDVEVTERDLFEADGVDRASRSTGTYTNTAIALGIEWYLTRQFVIEAAIFEDLSGNDIYRGRSIGNGSMSRFSPYGNSLSTDQIAVSARVRF